MSRMRILRDGVVNGLKSAAVVCLHVGVLRMESRTLYQRMGTHEDSVLQRVLTFACHRLYRSMLGCCCCCC